MKIAYFSYGMGTNINAWRFIEYFVDKGHDVHVISHESIKIDPRVKVHCLDRIWMFDQISFWLAVLMFRRCVDRIKPDILHGHFIDYYGHMCALSMFHPTILTVWGSDIYKRRWQSRRSRLLLNPTLRLVDRITVDSIDMGKEVQKYLKDASKIELVIMGIDRNLFRPGDGVSFRRKYDLGSDPVIVSTRHFTPLYNIDTIIRSIPYVLKEVPNAKFILKDAYGYLEPELRALAKELNVEHATRFIGETPYQMMPEIYQAGDIFVSIASTDGTPSSLLEAMACGASPIVSNVVSCKEWVSDRINGFVVDPKDCEALADRITRLLRDIETREKFRLRNFEIVAERGDYSKNMGRLEEIYLELCKKKKGLSERTNTTYPPAGQASPRKESR